MKLVYLPSYPMGKTLDMVLPGNICLCLAQQAQNNIAQNGLLSSYVTKRYIVG